VYHDYQTSVENKQVIYFMQFHATCIQQGHFN